MLTLVMRIRGTRPLRLSSGCIHLTLNPFEEPSSSNPFKLLSDSLYLRFEMLSSDCFSLYCASPFYFECSFFYCLFSLQLLSLSLTAIQITWKLMPAAEVSERKQNHLPLSLTHHSLSLFLHFEFLFRWDYDFGWRSLEFLFDF